MACVGAGAVVAKSADSHARTIRRHGYRLSGFVVRSLAVDVSTHLGPSPAALSVHAHVTCVRARIVSADGHACTVRGNGYRPSGFIARSFAVDVSAHLGPRPAALGVHAHVACVGAGAVVARSADRHARTIRRHGYRLSGLIARSLAVDVSAHLGPRPSALGVHAHVACVGAGAVVVASADRHACTIRGHGYRVP